ncbi:tumor necrosis factor ligand superfamily member 18-like [Antechinus flavipes]|uniref:tumor necrosis factor ligand superfamily member 18-like n=1 Tax=Antechinus flavipes TaxID=38775 RepID=UPI0022366EC5|nr:tumor necrosis factor ligand superfamily member 18-like [Antechinus flavipes]
MTQMENSVNLLERGMEFQDSERSSKKLWVICGSIVFGLSMLASSIYFFLHSKAPDNCWARAVLDTKTTATETNVWNWLNPSTCFKGSSNQTLMITKEGTYLVYVRMKRKRKDHVPFAIQLKKGNDILRQKQSEEDTIDLLEICHFNESDKISFTLNGNHFENIEKNPTQTFWGILRLPPHTPTT